MWGNKKYIKTTHLCVVGSNHDIFTDFSFCFKSTLLKFKFKKTNTLQISYKILLTNLH